MSFRIYSEPDENDFRVYADIDGETFWLGLITWLKEPAIWRAMAFTPAESLKDCRVLFITKGEAIEAVWRCWLDAQREEMEA